MSDEKELKPLTDKEFGDFLEGLGNHLEHEALVRCWTALEMGYVFIRNLIDGQIARGVIDDAPDKVKEMLRTMESAVDYGRPLVAGVGK